MAKLCLCGEKIGLGSRDLCWRCKERNSAIKNGLSLIHSCLLQFDLLAAPPKCSCRQFVTAAKAQAMVRAGDAVDFETRKAIFVADRALLLIGKRLTPGRATLSGRVTIERRGEDAGYSDDDIKRLQAIAVEDRALRHLERLKQVDIEHEITRAEFYSTKPSKLADGRVLSPLILTVPAEEFDRREEEDFGRPGIFVNGDSRTAGGIGVNVFVHEVPQNDCDEEDAAEEVVSMAA